MSGSRYIAVDLGAESGRVVIGTLSQGHLTLEEVHRFPNVPVRTPDGLHWDILRIYTDVLAGLKAAARRGGAFAGIGVDSWAVDFGLLDGGGRLLGNPVHYRDARTDGIPERAAVLVTAQEQYARTGIAQMQFNTIYQLMALEAAGDRSHELATRLLMVPDLIHYWLSGAATAEYTNATTSGGLGVEGVWARDLLERLGAPHHMLLEPTPPGTVVGELWTAVREECGLGAVPVILPATHDTACAVVAVPAEASGSYAYISCGTWSLLGLELDRPILTEEARLAHFTNEGGVASTYRFLTNISGLWLLQESRRAWARQGQNWEYQHLTSLAAREPASGMVIDVDDPAFLHPADMPDAIGAQLARTGQRVLTDPVALTRAIIEGLALKYRIALANAERLSGTRVDTIHIVGGGCHNQLLCQCTADCCGRRVIAGPTEGTALGNILVQAMGRGEVASLADAHAVARASSDTQVYEPRASGSWDEAEGRLREIWARANGS